MTSSIYKDALRAFHKKIIQVINISDRYSTHSILMDLKTNIDVLYILHYSKVYWLFYSATLYKDSLQLSWLLCFTVCS